MCVVVFFSSILTVCLPIRLASELSSPLFALLVEYEATGLVTCDLEDELKKPLD